MKREDREQTPEAQLRALIEKCDPNCQRLMRAVRAAVRKRIPTANELVYDYSDSVVIGYSPTERGIDGVLSIAARADGVRLYFMHGPELPDPKGLLLGSGKQTRFIRVEAATQLAGPDVKALIAAAIERASIPLAAKGKGRVLIRSGAAKKRPRRRPAK